MKTALRYIPTEVWVDVHRYPWITRKQLGKILHRFRNRKFVEILQYCLHDRGKQTLNKLYLDKETLPVIPRTQMPENIKFFKFLGIKRFGLRTVDFLRQISSLFTDVNLHLFCFEGNGLANIRTILDNLCPLLHGIHSISFNQDVVSLIEEQNFAPMAFGEFINPVMEQYFAQKLTQVKMISLDFGLECDPTTIQASIHFCINWLLSERDSTEPRFLKIELFETPDSEILQQFSKAVKQQFLSAKSACTFAIQLVDFCGHNADFADFHLENDLGEQLHGQNSWNFQILRHQPNGGKALQEWVEETNVKRYKSSVIEVSDNVTIESLDENAAENGVDEAGDEEEDGLSTSKKRKLTH